MTSDISIICLLIIVTTLFVSVAIAVITAAKDMRGVVARLAQEILDIKRSAADTDFVVAGHGIRIKRVEDRVTRLEEKAGA